MRITAAVSREGAPAPVLEEVDLEAPRADEILVRLQASGICHTDLRSHSGRGMPVPKPAVLGHEGVGVVEQVGAAVTHVKPGDRVLMSGGSCGHCPSCAGGRPAYCREAMPRSFGGRRGDGSTALSQNGETVSSHFFAQSSFASHCVANMRGAVPIPDDVPVEVVAPMGCGIITGAGAVIEALKVRPGQSIVVFGVGSVGNSAIMAAAASGATTIIAVDTNPERCELAKELGATHAVDASRDDPVAAVRAVLPFGANFSFNTATAPQVFEQAVQVLDVEGVAGFVTAPSGPYQPEMLRILAGGRSLKGILGGSAAPRTFVPVMIDLWRQGRFPVERLVTRYPFADFATAWDDCDAARVVKPVLVMEDR